MRPEQSPGRRGNQGGASPRPRRNRPRESRAIEVSSGGDRTPRSDLSFSPALQGAVGGRCAPAAPERSQADLPVIVGSCEYLAVRVAPDAPAKGMLVRPMS